MTLLNKLLICTTIVLGACDARRPDKAPSAFGTTNETAAAIRTSASRSDYRGTYRGTIPAADGPGIVVVLKLRANGTYSLRMRYLERASRIAENGTYTVQGNLLTLNSKEAMPAYYALEKDRLRMLDKNRQPVRGALADHYLLYKRF